MTAACGWNLLGTGGLADRTKAGLLKHCEVGTAAEYNNENSEH